MASSSPFTDQPGDGRADGFATVTAMAVSLSLSLTMAVVLVHAEVDLRASKSALDRSEAVYRLDAAQRLLSRRLRAHPDAIPDPGGPVDASSVGEGDGEVRLSVEREATKLGLKDGGELPDGWLESLRVADPQSLKSTLAAEANQDRRVTTTLIASASPSALWARCAEDLLSPYGAATERSAFGPGQTSGGLPITLRLIAVSKAGWRDDRIVRLNNDPANPVVLLDRRFSKERPNAPSCPSSPNRGGGA